ncbi:MAG: class I SAM-dependent methyltransferase [Chitinispirillaceae bacterium]|nr:class I SAM-dependent methyltransferase [Chitinispirillaceae bacterium]
MGRMIKKIMNALLSPLHLTIGRRLPGGLLIDPARQHLFEYAYRTVRSNTMLNRQRLSLLFELAEHCTKASVTGSFVECGVWKGGAAGMICCALQNTTQYRDLHLFDVFDDIGEPDWRIDGERAIREAGGKERAQGRLQPLKGIYNRVGGHGTEEACRVLLEQGIGWPSERIHVHQGWFQEILPRVSIEIGPIALLHLDADWYASTKICLDTLYDRVSKGGCVVIDDYGGYDGCRKAVDEFLVNRRLQPFRNHVDEECVYWFKE